MKVLMLLRGPIDSDSRVKKEISGLIDIGFDITLLSVNGMTLAGVKNHVLGWDSRRRVFPGVSWVLAFFKFLIFTVHNYRGQLVIHAHDLNTLPIAVFLKLLYFRQHIRIVYDTHEFATNDVPHESKLSQALKRYSERAFIRYCYQVITVSNSIAESYSRMYKIKKPVVIYNCPYLSTPNKADHFRKKFGIKTNEKIFLYQGALSEGRGIETLLDVFLALQNRNLVIVFMGYGTLDSLVKDYQNKSSNIFYNEAVPQSVLLEYTASADIGVALIENSCESYRLCLPNKLFEYLMAGLPVIVSNLPEMKKLVRSHEVGLVCQFNDFDSAYSVINKASSMNLSIFEKNLQSVNLEYNWEKEILKLQQIYQGLLENVG